MSTKKIIKFQEAGCSSHYCLLQLLPVTLNFYQRYRCRQNPLLDPSFPSIIGALYSSLRSFVCRLFSLQPGQKVFGKYIGTLRTRAFAGQIRAKTLSTNVGDLFSRRVTPENVHTSIIYCARTLNGDVLKVNDRVTQSRSQRLLLGA